MRPNISNMNPNKAFYEKSDFTRLAETMRKSTAAFIKKLNNMKD